MTFWKKKKKVVVPAVPVEVAPPPPPVIEVRQGLRDAGAFYDQIRFTKLFGPVFSTTEFQGVEEIIKDCSKANWPIAYVAYALATAYHETSGTMQPIKEYGGNAYYTKLYDVTGRDPVRARKMGNINPGDGARYCGRGYVQLTWKNNYQKAEDELGVELVDNPDLALVPDIASDIMIRGMQEGWFTGKSLATYLPSAGEATEAQFKLARKIINGTDKDALIADYAMSFQEALRFGEWS